MTEYDYSSAVPPGVLALNVGWLGPEVEFPQGEPPEEFVPALTELCARHSCNRMRGWQRCQLEHPAGETEHPLRFDYDAKRVAMGDAEVRVTSQDGRLLIAPNLVLHYVTEHKYLPPREFIESVIRFIQEEGSPIQG